MTHDASQDAIAPHGGVLVDREATPAERTRWEKEAPRLPALALDKRALSDLEMIVIGGFSPLEGFMGEADWASVVERTRLASGLVWSVPITLGVAPQQAKALAPGADVALKDEAGSLIAILHVTETYRPDKAPRRAHEHLGARGHGRRPADPRDRGERARRAGPGEVGRRAPDAHVAEASSVSIMSQT